MQKHLLAIAASAAATLASANAATVLLFEDDFDTEVTGANQALDNFNITRGLIDVLGPRYFDLYRDTGGSVDLDGSPGSATIATKNQFQAGPGTYTLTFDLGMNAGFVPSARTVQSELEVSFGSWSMLYDVDEIYYANPDSVITDSFLTTRPVFTTITETFTVDANGLSALVFSELGMTDSFGAVIDNIRFEFVPLGANSVPLPAAGLMMFTALAGFGAMRKRRIV